MDRGNLSRILTRITCTLHEKRVCTCPDPLISLQCLLQQFRQCKCCSLHRNPVDPLQLTWNLYPECFYLMADRDDVLILSAYSKDRPRKRYVRANEQYKESLYPSICKSHIDRRHSPIVAQLIFVSASFSVYSFAALKILAR